MSQQIRIIAGVVFVVLSIVVILAVVLTTGGSSDKELEEPDHLFRPFIPSIYNGTICKTDLCDKTAQDLLATINFKADPCNNFYDFVCGKFMKNTRLKNGENIRGQFNDASVNLQRNLKSLLGNYAVNGKQTSALGKAASLYHGCVAAENSKNMELLKGLFSEYINGWPLIPSTKSGKFNWSTAIAKIIRHLHPKFFFEIQILPDSNNSSKPMIAMYFSIPDSSTPNSFMKPLPRLPPISEYNRYPRQMITNIVCAIEPKCQDNQNLYAQITALLNTLSELQSSPVSSYMQEDSSQSDEHNGQFQAGAVTGRFTVNQLQATYPKVNWMIFFNTVFNDTDYKVNGNTLVFTAPKVLEQMVAILDNYNQNRLQIYFGWKMIQMWGPILSSKIREELGLTSSTEDKCVELANSALGYAVGNLYETKLMPKGTISEATTIVNNLRAAFRELIGEEQWMDKSTQDYAIKKLDKMVQSISSPEWTKTESGLNQYYQKMSPIDKSDFQSGFKAARDFHFWKQASFLGKPWDKANQWFALTTAQVSAFYFPYINGMMFSAGILAHPFLIPGRPSAVNYGSFGYVAGHEITHGFDDTGSQRDENGALRNWWSSNSKREFDTRKQCFVNQYETILEPLSGKYLNGEKTLGENIADNGGVREAYRAFKKAQATQPEVRPAGLTMFTLDQLFFLSTGYTYCTLSSAAMLNWQIQNDEHAPNIYRVSEPMRNSEEFSKAFNCPLDSRMNPVKKCKIW